MHDKSYKHLVLKGMNTGESSMTEENGYTTVKIPNDLAQEVDAMVGTHGFKSRGEFAKEAIRRLLKEYEKEA